MNLQEGKGVRKLQREGSHAESPAKKETNVEEKVPSDEEGELDEDMGRKRTERKEKEEGRTEEDKLDSMNNMMMKMMNMMTDMKKELRKDVSDVKDAVEEARNAAKGAEIKVDFVTKEVEVLREDMERMESTIDNMKTDFDNMATETVKTVEHLQSQVNTLRVGGDAFGTRSTHRSGKGTALQHTGATIVKGGKAVGKGKDDSDKRSRTVYFGKFPDDTQGETIKKFVDEWTNDCKEDIEETYPIGTVGERGAARFHSEDKMWAFMTRNKGNLRYEALGQTVYASLDSCHDDNPDRTHSIRKMVRAVIEKTGGDGRKVRNEQMKGTSYSRGRVYFQGARVAEWDEAAGVLVIKEAGKDFEDVYKRLMNQE